MKQFSHSLRLHYLDALNLQRTRLLGAAALLLICAACSSGPKPLNLPDGTFKTDINAPLDIASSTPGPILLDGSSTQGIDSSPRLSGPMSTRLTAGNSLDSPAQSPLPSNPVIELVPEQVWQLQKGETIRSELTKWAKDSDWSLVWQLDKDWVIPSNSQFSGGFDVAAAKVVETLSSNGVLIHANFYSSNKTLVITGPGVTPQ